MSGVIEVLGFTLGLSLALAILYRLLTDPQEMRRIKAEMKRLQDKSKKAQKAGNMEEVNAITGELLKQSQKQFSQNMKPMMASMLIFFVFLGWVGAQYSELVVNMPFYIPFIGSQTTWFVWYIIITLPSTFFFRKLLGVE
ncbi:MAG: hypothetical protein DRO99_00425 [Candidatus Aenigmatarchaeota archaeon]|nr:MAG: hypothetical protein DRO99_00425 [Candidatus Aenigmarchaeota archaeon]